MASALWKHNVLMTDEPTNALPTASELLRSPELPIIKGGYSMTDEQTNALPTASELLRSQELPIIKEGHSMTDEQTNALPTASELLTVIQSKTDRQRFLDYFIPSCSRWLRAWAATGNRKIEICRVDSEIYQPWWWQSLLGTEGRYERLPEKNRWMVECLQAAGYDVHIVPQEEGSMGASLGSDYWWQIEVWL